MTETGGFADLSALARLMCEAATVLHGHEPLETRLTWAVEACRGVTGADFAAYAVVADGTVDILAASGVHERDVAIVVSRQMQDVVRLAMHVDSPMIHPTEAVIARSGMTLPWRSLIRVPVIGGGGDLHGGLIVGSRRADAWSTEDALVVQALAAHLGTAVDNLETITRLAELEAAQREVVHHLQYALRPTVPTVEHAELGVHYLAADPSAPTGGDLYDWQLLADGDVHIVVVDVLGKGVAATKDALAVTHALRLLVLDGCPLENLIARADELVTAVSPELVATLAICRYRPSDGTMRLVSGGHPPALIVRADGRVEEVQARGIPIGWPGAGSKDVLEVRLDRSDSMVLYTDGLVEASKDIIIGLQRLAAAAGDTASYPAQHMARTLVERALDGAARFDDALALVLRRRVPPRAQGIHILGPFEHRFTPSAATVNLARHLFTDWLRLQPMDQEERNDLLVIAGELCTNALRAASGSPGSVALRAWTESSAVVVEVEDDGPGFEPSVPADGDVPDPEAESGRGLFLVDALADGLEVERSSGRTLVRARRDAVLADRARASDGDEARAVISP